MIQFNLYNNRSLEGKVDLIKNNFPDVDSRVILKSVKFHEPVFRGFRDGYPFTVSIDVETLSDIIKDETTIESVEGNRITYENDLDNYNLRQNINGIEGVKANPDKENAGKFAVKTNSGFVNTRGSVQSLKSGLFDCLENHLFGVSIFGVDIKEKDLLSKTLILKSEGSNSNINIKDSGVQVLSGDGGKYIEVNTKQTTIGGDLHIQGETNQNSPMFLGIPEKENDLNSIFPSSNLALTHLNKIIRIMRIISLVQSSVGILSKIISLSSQVANSNSYDNAINNINTSVNNFRNSVQSSLVSRENTGNLVQSTFIESAKILGQNELVKNLERIRDNQ